MTRTYLCRILGLIIVGSVAAPWTVHSYGLVTHGAISAHAFMASANVHANFFDALQINSNTSLGLHTAEGWVIAGSQDEDSEPLPPGTVVGSVIFPFGIPGARPLFHFLDPYYSRGLSVPGLIGFTSTASDWGIFGLGESLLSVGGLSIDNDFPYASSNHTQDARTHYYNGLTSQDPADRDKELGLTFRSIGQVIHLLQDTAQPQHVRNDIHLDLEDNRYLFWVPGIQFPSAYEQYVDAQPALHSLNGSGRKISFILPQLFFANGLGSGLAQFTNSGFVSAGTNCTNTVTCNAVGNYPAPSMSGGPTNVLYWTLPNADGSRRFGSLQECRDASIVESFPLALCTSVITFYTNQVVDRYTGGVSQNSRMTTSSLFDLDLLANGSSPRFSLNTLNYASQAQLLIPMAVDYSSGLLDYFFRGSMTAKGGNTGFAITNTSKNDTSPEDMDGTFSLYYDDLDGNRHLITTWPQVSISSGNTSSQLNFTPPTNPPPKTPDQYILVFNGTLGHETGAVVGVQFDATPVARLTVQLVGFAKAFGRVISMPSGIDCQNGCVTQTAALSGSVQLTASSSEGAVFVGWAGNCSGTTSTLTLDMSVGSLFCTAEFEPASELPLISTAACTIDSGAATLIAVGSLSGSTNTFVGITPSVSFDSDTVGYAFGCSTWLDQSLGLENNGFMQCVNANDGALNQDTWNIFGYLSNVTNIGDNPTATIVAVSGSCLPGSFPGCVNSEATSLVIPCRVSPGPEIFIVGSSSLFFTAAAGGDNPESQSFRIVNAGSGTLNWGILPDPAFDSNGNASWLIVQPGGGTGDDTVYVSVDITGLPVGDYIGSVEVFGDGPEYIPPQLIFIGLTITPP